MNFKVLAFLSCIGLLSSCSSTKKIAALKPEPDNTPLVYETSTSFISLPVSLKLKEIESQANKNVNGLLYEDNSFDKDNLQIKVLKTAPFEVSNENGRLKTVIPLKVTGTYRIGSEAFGFSLYDTKNFAIAGVITLVSDVAIINWKLQTKTTLEKIDWTETPSIEVAGAKISLSFLLNSALNLFRPDIEKAIDDAIKNAADFRPQVFEALEKLSTPILVNPEFQTWFKVNPIELYSTESKLLPDAISLNMGLKCNMETYIGQKPTAVFDKKNVVLKPVQTMPDKITLSVAAITGYAEASAMMAKNFEGKEFVSGKRKVTINKVDLWQKAGKLIVSLNLSGSINGTVYLSGLPKYDREKQEIFVDELDYVLDSKSRLTRSASWLLQGLVLKSIKENCRYSIKKDLTEAKKSMEPFLKNYSPVKGVLINGTLESLDFDKIQLSNKAIVAFITATGTMDVKVEGL